MTRPEARFIVNEWYAGQWSAGYAFVSTDTLDPDELHTELSIAFDRARDVEGLDELAEVLDWLAPQTSGILDSLDR